MAGFNSLNFGTLWVAFSFHLFQAAHIIQQLASNQDSTTSEQQLASNLHKTQSIRSWLFSIPFRPHRIHFSAVAVAVIAALAALHIKTISKVRYLCLFISFCRFLVKSIQCQSRLQSEFVALPLLWDLRGNSTRKQLHTVLRIESGSDVALKRNSQIKTSLLSILPTASKYCNFPQL